MYPILEKRHLDSGSSSSSTAKEASLRSESFPNHSASSLPLRSSSVADIAISTGRSSQKHSYEETRLQDQENELRASETGSPPTNDQRVPSMRKGHDPTARTTRVLQRTVLLAFAGLCVLIFCAVEILNFFSQRYNGLATADQKLHYLWTFGPTFVFSVLASFWARVEYRIRQTTPWTELSNGPSEARKTLLLNYSTAPLHSTISQSIKNAHYTLTAAVCGSLLLQLIIISSTALLSLESRNVSHDHTIRLLDKFDFTNGLEGPDTNGLPRLWAIKTFNSTYPTGTTEDFAVQSFATTNDEGNGTFSAEVEVFTANLDSCEAFQWEYVSNTPKYELHARLLSSSFLVQDYIFYVPQNISSVSIAIADHVNCSSTQTGLESSCIITFFERCHAEQLPEISGIICSPSYSLNRRVVSQTSRASLLASSMEVSDTPTELLPIGNTSETITKSIVWSMNGRNLEIEANMRGILTTTSPWFQVLKAGFSLDSISALNDTTLLRRASEELFPQFAAQWAKASRTLPLNDTIAGKLSVARSRLCIQLLPLRLIEVFTLLLSIAAIGIAYSTKPFHGGDPGTLIFYLLAFGKSNGLKEIMRDSGTATQKALKINLSAGRFSTIHENSCALPKVMVETAPRAPQEHKEDIKWWQPFSARFFYRVAAVIAPLILITVLETLFQLSVRKTGIATVSTEGYTKLVWAFAPGATMSLLGLAYSSLDFSTRILLPYQMLRKGLRDLRPMTHDPFGSVPLVLILEAFKDRQTALLATLSTVILTSMLTIAASGLYTPQSVPLCLNTSLNLDTWFNFNDHNTSLGTLRVAGQPIDIANIIQYENMPFPQWTHNDLSFPTLSMASDQKARFSDKTVALTARIPAARTRMNCSLLAYYRDQDLSVTSRELVSGAEFTPPLQCAGNLENGTRLSTPVNIDHSRLGSLRPAYMAQAIYTTSKSLVAEPFDQHEWRPFGDFCDDGRRHFWYMVGQKIDNSFPNTSLIHCMPYVEVLLVDTAFTVPAFQIDEAAPPSPVEASARITEVTDDFFLDRHSAGTQVETVRASAKIFRSDLEISPYVDEFFQAILYGADGTPIEDLIGEQNADNLISKMERVWNQNMAQAIRKYHSPPLNALDVSQAPAVEYMNRPMNGTIFDATRLRLIQSPTSTRILEAVLLMIAICAMVSLLLNRDMKVLPKDPGSIAAKMSLFADSELIAKVQHIEPWNWDTSMWKDVVEGSLLSLGWWEGNSDRGRRRFGVDIGRAQRY